MALNSSKKRQFLKFLIIFILMITGYLFQEEIKESIDSSEYFNGTKEVNFDNITIKYNLVENSSADIQVLFCPIDNCFDAYKGLFTIAQNEIKCALHEFDNEELSNLLVKRSDEGLDVEILIDGKYINEDGIHPLLNSSVILYSDGNRSKLMHHKFCVVDDSILLTGSTNPTENGFFYNNNNLLLIQSDYLVKNFENEFDIMASGKFGPKKHSVLEYNNITLKYGDNSYKLSTYMCPKDDCKKATLEILNSSQNEILMMSFVLTLNEIESLLVEKNNEGITIKGLIETRSVNLVGSKIKELSKEFELRNDTNSKTMHNKVFIVDEKYVITGSMNPSSSGTKYNDENLIIIESEKIAKEYKQEFERLFNS